MKLANYSYFNPNIGSVEPDMDCSIIICTRNRASMLEKTFLAFQGVRVPDNLKVELIVADNGSIDNTAEVISKACHPHMEIRHIYQPRPGKSRAQNTALAAATGKVLLFTDDDVEPAGDWIEKMARPLLDGRCDAVAGRILLGEELRRPWLTKMHELWLAVESEPKGESPILIGACMGLHRSVFDQIDPFDEELGPGASGFGEETLLWWQMKEAGLRILPVTDTFVIHHPELSRLQRTSWLAAAARFGRTGAYLMYHWEHTSVGLPALQASTVRAKLFLRRLFRREPPADFEGCPDWEMSYIMRLEMLRQLKIESRKSRNYGRRALRKKISAKQG